MRSDLEFPEVNRVDQVIRPLAHYQVRPLAGGKYIFTQVCQVDGFPDPGRGFLGFHIRQFRVSVRV